MQVKGLIIKGIQQASKSFSLPTANLDSPDFKAAPGIYAAIAKLGDESYNGICFIGKAWLVQSKPNRVEVHLFDYVGKDFYGEAVSVLLKKKIRDVIEFTSKDQAREIINNDIKSVKDYFGK